MKCRLLFLFSVSAASTVAADRVRSVQSLDAEWLFARGDMPAAEKPMFDDANWRTIDVPHDWAIEDAAEKDAAVGRGGGYRASGVSWYRKAELTLNGKSLGAKPMPADASPRTWKVSFEPGTLKAIGKNVGKSVATHELRTAGAPAKLLVIADRPRVARDWNDVATVSIAAVDANGVSRPWADALVTFRADGPGAIVAVDNGDRADPSPLQATERRLFRGECVAFVKAGTSAGRITVIASAPGLAESSVTLEP